ncbi:MAG: glycosyltransferase family 39 protein [Pyrinomonadaceae bacterium]
MNALKDHRQLLIIVGVIFLVAVGLRLLFLYDPTLEARKVQTSVVVSYMNVAHFMAEDGIATFVSSPISRVNAPNYLGHPPGYSILLGFVFKLFNDSDRTVQLIQILFDGVSAVLVFLIAAELLSLRVAVIAGALVALAPQLAYHSVLLLPDTLSVLPLLLAVYFIVRARKRPRLVSFIIAGICVGLSCWLRANALFLVLFLAAVTAFTFERGRRLRFALALVAGTVLAIAPMTIRNALIYRYFIPVSLGSGQTLLEGIADYDRAGRFGVPETDVGITNMEAEMSGCPAYSDSLFSPDGVERERLRIARGWGVIRSNPLWFAGVMVARASSMLRLERVPQIAARPSLVGNLSHALVWLLQKLFLTACMLPLYVLGLVLLLRREHARTLAILLAVPLYFLCAQSALHTEYRYVLAVHYFLFIPAAFALSWAGRKLWMMRRRLPGLG